MRATRIDCMERRRLRCCFLLATERSWLQTVAPGKVRNAHFFTRTTTTAAVKNIRRKREAALSRDLASRLALCCCCCCLQHCGNGEREKERAATSRSSNREGTSLAAREGSQGPPAKGRPYRIGWRGIRSAAVKHMPPPWHFIHLVLQFLAIPIVF